MKNHNLDKDNKIRLTVDKYFDIFRENYFRKLVKTAIRNRISVLAIAFACFALSLGLVAGGHINFTFFPSPEGRTLSANVQFSSGTNPGKVAAFIQEMNRALKQTDNELSKDEGPLVQNAVSFQNQSGDDETRNKGEQYASMMVELKSPDARTVRNREFIKAWYHNIRVPAGVENLTVSEPRVGPPGGDIDMVLTGSNSDILKAASLEAQQYLGTFQGLSNIKDDMPYGQEQLIYELSPVGHSLNLSIESVGLQIRAAFSGAIAQIYHDPLDEIEVRVILPDDERNRLSILEQFPIVTATGESVPLGTVVNLKFQRNLDTLRHTDSYLSLHVAADVDSSVTNANNVLAKIQQEFLRDFTSRYPIKVRFEGRADEQAETFQDMKYGLGLGLMMIYIILAWVFSSYGWPLVVMTAIPLGLTGAIFGHYIMGIDLTILSLFGFFGLSGIVVNDSIILLSEYKHLRASGLHKQYAIVEASCKRLRAVLLTSLTTIAGLTPLLFERSLQAQFLIPMAVSISFGLAFATFLILVVIPSLLSIYESIAERFQKSES